LRKPSDESSEKIGAGYVELHPILLFTYRGFLLFYMGVREGKKKNGYGKTNLNNITKFDLKPEDVGFCKR